MTHERGVGEACTQTCAALLSCPAHTCNAIQVASTVETKQKAGDEALSAKKYGEALAAYDEALKALPDRHALVAELHANKANVYLTDKKCEPLLPAMMR